MLNMVIGVSIAVLMYMLLIIALVLLVFWICTALL